MIMHGEENVSFPTTENHFKKSNAREDVYSMTKLTKSGLNDVVFESDMFLLLGIHAL